MERMRTCIIIGFVFANFVDCQEEYCISNHRQAGNNATALCTLATPPFSPDGTSYVVNLNIRSNESLWIGYAETALSYIGCVKLYDLDDLRVNSTKQIANASDCVYQCGTPVIGIGSHNKRQNCFCITSFSNGPNLNYKYCSSVCEFPYGTLCGGKDAISIYQKVDYPATIRSDKGHCLAYNPIYSGFFWTSCKRSFQGLCMTGSGKLEPITQYASWSQSMMNCINEGMIPVSTSEYVGNLPIGNGPMWIGKIRNIGICAKPASLCNDVDVRRGYIKSTSSSLGHYELNFGLDQTLAALCESDIDSDVCSSVHLSTTKPSSKLTSTSGSNADLSQSSTIDIATQPSSENGKSSATTGSLSATVDSTTQLRAEKRKVSPAKGGLSAIVAVYVAVPIALLLIVAAVVGYPLWRKRTRPLVAKSESNNHVSSDRTPEDESNGSTMFYEYENECVVVTDTETARYDPLVFGSSNDNEYSVLNNTETERPVHHNTENERHVYQNI